MKTYLRPPKYHSENRKKNVNAPVSKPQKIYSTVLAIGFLFFLDVNSKAIAKIKYNEITPGNISSQNEENAN